MKIMTPNSSTGHQASEKFLVAVNQSPNAENLIRKGHEMASFHNAPWFAVHVSKSDDLSPDDRTALAENIHLARELGAEIIIIHDDDFAQAILKIAKEKKITQIVIGGPRHRKSRSLITKLITQSNGLCVHILDKANVFLKGHKQVIKDTILPPVRIFNSRPINYLYTIFLLIFVTLISALLNPYLEYRAVGYLYLMAVIAVGFSGTLGPILLSAIGGAFIWNFVFIPPRFTFHIHDPEDRMMCMTFIFAGVLSGFPARKTRKREKLLLLREHNTRNLYNLLNDFAKAMSVNEICDLAEKSVMDLMNSNIAIILSASERDLPNRTINSRSLSNQDFALAQLSFKHKKPAGWSTKIFSDSRCLSIPLIATQAIGVVLFYPPTLKMQLSLDEESLLNNICLQLATALEHLILQNQKQEIQLFKESEKLHQTLLNSVSHEMRIPLTSILGNINALQNEKVQS
ncbi:MAG: DUF4118 domain-containing protein, partial [Bacteriovorax sp.]